MDIFINSICIHDNIIYQLNQDRALAWLRIIKFEGVDILSSANYASKAVCSTGDAILTVRNINPNPTSEPYSPQ
jgi:hypothetical protein